MGEEELDQLLTAVEATLGVEWVGTVDWLRDQNALDAVEARIVAGDIAGAVTGIEEAAARFAAEVADGYLVSGQQTAAWLDSLIDDKLVTFDATNQRAVEWARTNQLQLRGGVLLEQQQVIQHAIVEGVAAGRNPREVARDIRDSIGLTDHQRAHVASYRRALESGDWDNALGRALRDKRSDRSIRAARAAGEPLTPAQIDKMVERYHRNYLTYRAETIGRTEALRAVHQGADEAFEQAIELGQLDVERLEFEWLAGSPPRSRDWHAIMNHQKRARGVPFESGHGTLMMYPGDPSAPIDETARCRCKRTARLKPVVESAV